MRTAEAAADAQTVITAEAAEEVHLIGPLEAMGAVVRLMRPTATMAAAAEGAMAMIAAVLRVATVVLATRISHGHDK